MASVSNYGKINSVNTADLDKDKNMTVKQYPKSNTIQQHSDLSLVSHYDISFSFKRNIGPHLYETNIGESPSAPYRTTTNHNKSKHTYNLRNWVITEKH